MSDIETKIAKVIRQRVEIVNVGNTQLPSEVKTPGYVYRKFNVDSERPLNIFNAYKKGWENLTDEEAEGFREKMGTGIFRKTSGDGGDGSIFEIPLTAKLSMRILRMPVEVSEAIQRHRVKQNLEKRKRLENSMVFGPDGQPANVTTTGEVGYGEYGR